MLSYVYYCIFNLSISQYCPYAATERRYFADAHMDPAAVCRCLTSKHLLNSMCLCNLLNELLMSFISLLSELQSGLTSLTLEPVTEVETVK